MPSSTLVLILSCPMFLAISESTIYMTSIWVSDCSFSVKLVVDKIANIANARILDLRPFTMECPILKRTFVFCSIGVDNRSLSVPMSVLELTFVFIAHVALFSATFFLSVTKLPCIVSLLRWVVGRPKTVRNAFHHFPAIPVTIRAQHPTSRVDVSVICKNSLKQSSIT
jgi:hypothetical protein